MQEVAITQHRKSLFSTTLIHRARAISDSESLQTELYHLHHVFLSNGYTECHIQQATSKSDLSRPDQNLKGDEKKIVVVLFGGDVSFKIGRLLIKAGINTYFHNSTEIDNLVMTS